MKRLIIYIFALFFISANILLAINHSFQKRLGSFKVEKNNDQKKLTKEKQSLMAPSDASFIIEKDKVLAMVKKSPLYFNTKIQKLAFNRWKITVMLEGEIEGAADVADLRLELSKNLTVSDLKVGPAFPIYPRKVIAANYLLVTGLISTNSNQMIFGRPNKIFTEFTVQATNNQLNKKQITVNKEETKIFLNGESVLDTSKSVGLIDLF